MRVWLLSSTFYGNWLPGDPRGSVTRVREIRRVEAAHKSRHYHNQFGTPFDKSMPGLHRHAASIMKGPPILVNEAQAAALVEQFQETAEYRHWQLHAAAVMANHVHIVAEVFEDPDPSYLLRDFKSYGSRPLNRRWGKPPSDTWWTQDGSKRIRKTAQGRIAAAVYVAFKQPRVLMSFLNPELALPAKYEVLRRQFYGPDGLRIAW